MSRTFIAEDRDVNETFKKFVCKSLKCCNEDFEGLQN